MTIQLKGGKELAAFLDAFPTTLVKGAVRSGLTAAARPIRDHARSLVEAKSGKLRKSIKTGSPKVNEDGTVSVRVKLQGEHSFLGHFLEYGVAPHLIARTGAKQGRVAVRKAKEGTGTIQSGVMLIGDDFVSGIISHPGIAARPFMRPALDTKAQDAITAFGDRVASYLKTKTGFTAPARLEVDE